MSSPLPGGEPVTAPPPLPPPAPVPSPYARLPKNPWVSLVLSFVFPGIGQVYNGQPAKALVFFAAFAGCIYGVAETGAIVFGLLIPFVYLFNLVDAYRSADTINARFQGGRPVEEEGTESPAWGVSLIGLGLLLLFNNLGWIHLAAVQRYWPVLLILIGAGLFFGALRRRQRQSE